MRPRYCDGHPEAQEQDRAGEEAGLGDAEQEAQHDELLEVLHPGEQQRDDAPADHDAREPAARAELVQREVRGHLEQDVADEEDARREAELRGAQREVLVHAVGGGEADGGAVEVVDEEHQRHEGHQTQRDLSNGRFRDGRLYAGHDGGVVHVDSWGIVLDSSASGACLETILANRLTNCKGQFDSCRARLFACPPSLTTARRRSPRRWGCCRAAHRCRKWLVGSWICSPAARSSRGLVCPPNVTSPPRWASAGPRCAKRSPRSRSSGSSTSGRDRARTCAARRANCCRRPCGGACSSGRRAPPSFSSSAQGSRSTSPDWRPAEPGPPERKAIGVPLDRMRADIDNLKAFARADLDFHNALATAAGQRHAGRPASRRPLVAAGLCGPRGAR